MKGELSSQYLQNDWVNKNAVLRTNLSLHLATLKAIIETKARGELVGLFEPFI